ncbi:helitron helicase-like domain-containing protein [Artemisia annua]|uniref:Helitron helicase-like domain-containing protein n=1 Tax=Artemisia annua TaxID=35608 RepID=A0A2U1PU51_ARTAN|nr:helitron helicase-like domain-containing protein [Artemisia annua]
MLILVAQISVSGSPRTDIRPRELPPARGRTRRSWTTRPSPGPQHRRTGATRVQANRRRARTGRASAMDRNSSPVQGPIAPPQREGAPLDYKSFGRCDQVCQHCHAIFWLEERRTGLPGSAAPQYQRCCAGGRVFLRTYEHYPQYITNLFSDRHFMDNIRAYNQMFAMTSVGATIDNSINTGRGPYVFRVSEQIYHWIGGFCPNGDDSPRFLQMYVYDTDHEVQHRLSHFDPHERRILREDIIQGLIQFLDDNNALVHLFRTARDKLRDANIPNFQIRLFGVAGSSQYELPTAETIGAIVYEGGPESITDYDVVIERHSREPESVNKLHPTNMALQFPLLFVYGEEGNVDAASKAVAGPSIPQRTFAYFTDLNPTDNTKFIEARVYRKWIAMKVPSLIATGFSCILLDKKGSAIQANTDLKEKDRFDLDLQLNCVCRIQGFGFEKTDGWGKTLDNDFTLSFGKHTHIKPLTDTDFPYHYFNFAAYNELGARLEKKSQILTDYIGYVHNVEKVKEYGSATANKIKLRNIAIRNLNYSFRVIIIDGTGNATMTCFSPQTDGLIKNIDALLQEVDNKDPAIIPPQILALQNTRHVFQFRFAKPAGKGPPTLVLQQVMDHPPAILPAPAEGPSSPPGTPLTAHTLSHISPPPATPAATQDTPENTDSGLRPSTTSATKRELFATAAAKESDPPSTPPTGHTLLHSSPPDATPPATQDSLGNTTSEAHLSTTSTTRKELFAATTDKENDPEAKKQKTE